MIRRLDYPIGTRLVIEIAESDLSCDECCFFLGLVMSKVMRCAMNPTATTGKTRYTS